MTSLQTTVTATSPPLPRQLIITVEIKSRAVLCCSQNTTKGITHNASAITSPPTPKTTYNYSIN